jgi:hypothetical protein
MGVKLLSQFCSDCDSSAFTSAHWTLHVQLVFFFASVSPLSLIPVSSYDVSQPLQAVHPFRTTLS